MSNDNVPDDRIARFVFEHPHYIELDHPDARAMLRLFGIENAVPATMACAGMKLELLFDLGESEQR